MKAQAVVQIHGSSVPHVERVDAKKNIFRLLCDHKCRLSSGTPAVLPQNGWIRPNKLLAEVEGASVNHSQSKRSV